MRSTLLVLLLMVFLTSAPHSLSYVLKKLVVLKNSKTSCWNTGLETSFSYLEQYNSQYLERMKAGRKEGKSPMKVELERAQLLKSEGIKLERSQLREAILNIKHQAKEISLGIMAETGALAVSSLKAYVSGLNMSHGVLHGTDDAGQYVEVSTLMNVPVYLKYNSSDPNSAYMKKYRSDGFVGVIFQPDLGDGNFRQYGDLPLQLF